MPLDLLDIHHMKGSAQFTTTVFKASKDSRLGINLTPRARGPHTVTVVTNDGLLAGSGIAPRQLLTSINGISTGGLTSQEAIGALKDAVGEITLGVTKLGPQISFGYTGGKSCKMNASTCESLFAAAGVPQDTHRKIYKMVEDELLPVALSGWIMRETFYSGGFGGLSDHAQKPFLGLSQLAALQRNVDLVAMQVKDKVNAILSKYGILATYARERHDLPNHSWHKQEHPSEMLHIVGLEFR